ncbi:MAG: hypothetical protein WBS33_00790 [Verrucomicrobiia bacterium]|jgi:hypothetical protein
MTSQIYNEEHRQFLSRKVVAAAQSILSGELGIIAGARQLCGLGHKIGAERDPDFTFFVAIESESDHLPVGEVRQHWNPEALRAKDAEIASFEAFYREQAFEICRRLIERYDHDA